MRSPAKRRSLRERKVGSTILTAGAFAEPLLFLFLLGDISTPLLNEVECFGHLSVSPRFP
jgi:hypothetical protein